MSLVRTTHMLYNAKVKPNSDRSRKSLGQQLQRSATEPSGVFASNSFTRLLMATSAKLALKPKVAVLAGLCGLMCPLWLASRVVISRCFDTTSVTKLQERPPARLEQGIRCGSVKASLYLRFRRNTQRVPRLILPTSGTDPLQQDGNCSRSLLSSPFGIDSHLKALLVMACVTTPRAGYPLVVHPLLNLMTRQS